MQQHQRRPLYLFLLLLVSRKICLCLSQQIDVASDCHSPEDDFVVSFAGSTNHDDWIGVIPASRLDNQLLIRTPHLVTWSWKCGFSQCNDDEGVVRIPNALPSGDYVAVLAKNGLNQPFQGLSRSAPFSVQADCRLVSADAVTGSSVQQQQRPPTISLSKSTYAAGETIRVQWNNHITGAAPDDFLAIYPSGVSTNQLENGILWIWTCNRQGSPCEGSAPAGGRVDFDASTVWTSQDDWPLFPGTYRAHLVRNAKRNNDRFWNPVAVSDRFTVVPGPLVVQPVPRPSLRPTSLRPVPVPLQPRGGISVEGDGDSSFSVGETFWINFQNPSQALVSDWVGVFPIETPQDQLSTALLWKWTCNRQGTTTCSELTSSGRVEMGPDAMWSSDDWPLSRGFYKAYLLRDSRNPFWEVIMESDPFTIGSAFRDGGSQPNLRPTQAPVRSAISSEELESEQAARDIASARRMLENIIRNDADLAPKFLRLIFHDCIGGCDGCVDLNNPENFGLDKPIDALETVFQSHGGVLSRADIWALGATVGTDVTQRRGGDQIDFPFEFYGRVDCTDHDVCFGSDGSPVACTPKHGPHHEHPTIHFNTAQLYHFFSTEFGFDLRSAVVAMGAHTIGSLSLENSGIDGPNGWVPDNTVFDSFYYTELVGGRDPDDPVETLVDDAPRWRRALDPPTDAFQNRRVWDGFPEEGKRIIMLNTDIALFRMLDDGNYQSDIGRATCGFEDETSEQAGIPKCPHVEQAVRIGASFKHNNREFMIAFEGVLKRMVSNRYTLPDFCNGSACKIFRND